MRVFITSTPDELEGCQMAAMELVRSLGHTPVLRDPIPRLGLDSVTACNRQIARVDALLAIVGFRRGRVPAGDLGGDGLQPWTSWEVASAFEHGVPVVALLAAEGYSAERESDPEAAALVMDLRGELARLGRIFEDLPSFVAMAEVALRDVGRGSWTPGPAPGDLKLREHPSPRLPPMPYPLLLPYRHPDLMAGRDDDLADLRRTLALPVTVVGLHAASGTGKSSILAGGLVPTLRAEGLPVAFDRHPTEVGLPARLLGDLLQAKGQTGALDASSPRDFVDRLMAVRLLAGGATPLLVIDQFEDLLKDGGESGLAELGPLLAASVQRLPGLEGAACRWLLAYRQEFYGRAIAWLRDVLRETRVQGLPDTDLPHDLSGPNRFTDWALRPLGTPTPGSVDAIDAASRVFLHAIEKPLSQPDPGVRLRTERSDGSRSRYPWAFAPGHAERLARAFGEARIRRPNDPLAPEFQVVLAHLLSNAGEASPDRIATVTVPDDTRILIDGALEQHLRRALDQVYPHAPGSNSRQTRTRALLVLRELAEVHRRRDVGQVVDLLAQALGDQGYDVLEKLATPRARLVLRERHGDAQIYVLAHSRLAEVLVQVVDEGRWAGLDIDSRLLGLRRFVALQSRLFDLGDVEQAPVVPPGYFEDIAANEEALLWNVTHRKWWQAVRNRRRVDRRRVFYRGIWFLMVVTCFALGPWVMARYDSQQDSLLHQIESAAPERALSALTELTRFWFYDQKEILLRLRERRNPFDIFERGLGGLAESHRAEALVTATELVLPILDESPENPKLVASLVWALDFFVARDPDFAELAMDLRNRALAPLRSVRPGPPIPEPSHPEWADIPAGTFWMGARSEERREDRIQDDLPMHEVTLSPFRIMVREVTNSEYRRLVPDHEGEDDLPAMMDWYQAYTYAAWVGGRLPTEAEWEYAARADCSHAYCNRDGSKAEMEEVAWCGQSSADPETDGSPSLKAVKLLEPNPFGLWDMLGNAAEWNANWFYRFSEGAQVDPPGPFIDTTTSWFDPESARSVRSPGLDVLEGECRPSARYSYTPSAARVGASVRVVIPRSTRHEDENRSSVDRKVGFQIDDRGVISPGSRTALFDLRRWSIGKHDTKAQVAALGPRHGSTTVGPVHRESAEPETTPPNHAITIAGRWAP